jgi:hypothetical protein
MATLDPTVESVLQILTAHLTQYDKRASSRRGYNPNALAFYFKAVGDIRSAVPAGPLTPSSAQALKRAIDRYFIVSDMPPARKTIKNIDDFLGGAPLKYPVSGKKAAKKKTAKKKPKLSLAEQNRRINAALRGK